MFIEINPGFYDVAGRKSYRPHLKKNLPPPTFPFGRYISRPLTVHCKSREEVRSFLRSCKQASDEETFGKKEYWLPPDEFEKLKKGDCDDFALWTWRQLVDMGYRARFVAGRFGRYRAGHAWVTFTDRDRSFIADGTRSPAGLELPQFHVLAYEPIYSVEWNGKDIAFYSHQKKPAPGLTEVLPLLPPYVWFWTRFWARNGWRWPWFLVRKLLRGTQRQSRPASCEPRSPR